MPLKHLVGQPYQPVCLLDALTHWRVASLISSRCRALPEAKRWAGVFPLLPAISAFASRKVSTEAPQSSQVTGSSSDAGKLKRLLPQLRHDRLAFFQTIPSLARHVRHGYGLSGRTSTNTAQMSALGSIVLKKSEDDIFVREGAKIESDLHRL